MLCFAIGDLRADTFNNDGRGYKIYFAGIGNAEDNNFNKITTLNVLVGSIGITFCGWILQKRKAS